MSGLVKQPFRDGFGGIVRLVQTHPGECTDALERYFTGDTGDLFTGRLFEHFSGLSNELHLDANDIAACGALSVPLSGKAIDGLVRNADQIDGLLARCPARGTTLWEVDPASPDYKALDELYTLVRSVPDIGYVTASKLLACKRPRLVPIRDQVVEGLLGTPKEWWAPWRDALTPELVKAAENLGGADVAHVSVLRKLDVILWMYGTNQQPLAAITV